MRPSSAPAPPSFALRLLGDDGGPYLGIVEVSTARAANKQSVEERVLELLAGSVPLTRAALRGKISVRNERLGEALAHPEADGSLDRKRVCRERV